MESMTASDWACLAGVERGENAAASSHARSRARLEAMQFIVSRPHNSFAITGLGRDALMRKKYCLGLPAQQKQYASAH